MGNTKKLTGDVVKAQLKKLADKDGYVTYKQPGIGGLRHAATREFGSWKKACEAAGVKARPRGRPSESASRGACPSCGREVAISKEGNVSRHKCEASS